MEMRSHLALAVDNTRPVTQAPAYFDALKDGRCMQCRQVKPGVRTAGIRRPDRTTWRWVTLCPGCIEAARAQPDEVALVAAVRIPVPPGALASSPDVPEPGKLPAARVPVTVARFAGKCPACADPVAVGEMITRGAGDGKWRHARCAGLRIRQA
jgi:hypothetical protein